MVGGVKCQKKIIGWTILVEDVTKYHFQYIWYKFNSSFDMIFYSEKYL